MAKWSWDEFAGGLAAGGVAGLGQGTDLARARNAARENELRTTLTFAGPIAGMADRVEAGASNQDALRTAINEVDPALTGMTDLSRARGMYAQTDESQRILDTIGKSRVEAAQKIRDIEERTRQQELKAGTLNDESSKYVNLSRQLDVVAQRVKETQQRMAQADAAGKSGETDFIAASRDLDRLEELHAKLRGELMGRAAALSGLGVSIEDINRLRSGSGSNEIRDMLIEKYAGTHKARGAGARSRPKP